MQRQMFVIQGVMNNTSDGKCCYGVIERAMDMLCQWIGRSNRLTHLSLVRCGLNQHNLTALGHAIIANGRIRTLDIRGNDLGECGIQSLYRTLVAGQSHIRSLGGSSPLLLLSRRRSAISPVHRHDHNTSSASHADNDNNHSDNNGDGHSSRPLPIGFGIEEILLAGNRLGSGGSDMWRLAASNRNESWRHRQRKRAVIFIASCRAHNRHDTSQYELMMAIQPLLTTIISLTGDHPLHVAPNVNDGDGHVMNPYCDFYSPADIHLDGLLTTKWAHHHHIDIDWNGNDNTHTSSSLSSTSKYVNNPTASNNNNNKRRSGNRLRSCLVS
jgi:hypothetical protein